MRSRCCRAAEKLSRISASGVDATAVCFPPSLMMNMPNDGASGDLHGNVPDSAQAVLLLIDVINDFDFPQNEYLLSRTAALSAAIRNLKELCKRAGLPCIYINDNHGKWRSDVHAVLQNALRHDAPGHEFVAALAPAPDDYIVLKPKHSAFFATPLQTLLESFGAKILVLAGITSNACVMISACDAYVYGYKLFVPRDCVAALTPEAQEEAMHLMQKSFGADTRPASALDLTNLHKS